MRITIMVEVTNYHVELSIKRITILLREELSPAKEQLPSMEVQVKSVVM